MGFQWPGVALPGHQAWGRASCLLAHLSTRSLPPLSHGHLLAAQEHHVFFLQRVPQVLSKGVG